MRRRGSFWAIVLLASVSFAQQPHEANDKPVTLSISIVHKKGEAGPDLEPADFRLREGRQEHQILSLRKAKALPRRVILLIDASNSSSNAFEFQRHIALEAARHLSRPGDQVKVIGFGSTIEVAGEFTDDLTLVKQQVLKLQPAGGTALYDALSYSAREVFLKGLAGQRYQPAIILISDGGENNSTISRDEALDMLIRAGAPVYSLGPGPVPSLVRSSRDWQRAIKLGGDTGGASFNIARSRNVDQAMAAIRQLLDNRYELSYLPSSGAERASIKLEVRGHKSLELAYPALRPRND
jgi:VWFA-related protein